MIIAIAEKRESHSDDSMQYINGSTRECL